VAPGQAGTPVPQYSPALNSTGGLAPESTKLNWTCAPGGRGRFHVASEESRAGKPAAQGQEVVNRHLLLRCVAYAHVLFPLNFPLGVAWWSTFCARQFARVVGIQGGERRGMWDVRARQGDFAVGRARMLRTECVPTRCARAESSTIWARRRRSCSSCNLSATSQVCGPCSAVD
jgi:hypothetical protein